MDIVRAHRPCSQYGPPCILGTGIPKHHMVGADSPGAAQANHVRDAYTFMQQRLRRDGEPQCNEPKHRLEYIDHVRERLSSHTGEVCKPWCVVFYFQEGASTF